MRVRRRRKSSVIPDEARRDIWVEYNFGETRSQEDIAFEYDCTAATISNTLKRFEEDCLDEFLDRVKCGYDHAEALKWLGEKYHLTDLQTDILLANGKLRLTKEITKRSEQRKEVMGAINSHII